MNNILGHFYTNTSNNKINKNNLYSSIMNNFNFKTNENGSNIISKGNC